MLSRKRSEDTECAGKRSNMVKAEYNEKRWMPSVSGRHKYFRIFTDIAQLVACYLTKIRMSNLYIIFYRTFMLFCSFPDFKPILNWPNYKTFYIIFIKSNAYVVNSIVEMSDRD